MNIFDIIGPPMIGPSSSHTAGAARLGKMARIILGETPKEVELILYGSFAETGWGHGTKLALIAGLLGLDPWDERLRDAFSLAEKYGLPYSFSEGKLRQGMHPNSVRFEMKGENCKRVMEGASIGGGKIEVTKIDDFSVSFSGEYPTIINIYDDRVGMVARVTQILADRGINIARMRVSRDKRMGTALMIIETDQMPSQNIKRDLKDIPYMKVSMIITPI